MSLSTEKKLALKISIISFFVLFFILGSIIFSSYIYSRNRAYMEFANEQHMFDGVRLMEDEREGSGFMPGAGILSRIEQGGGPRRGGPRDVVIFDSDRNIVKNDVILLDTGSTDKLFNLERSSNTTIALGEKRFLIIREEINGYTFFLLHDLTPLTEYFENLLIIGLIGSILGFIIIFMMASHLAKITITPIREHNQELEAYSHNVAHELRTPLAVMKQNLELLKLKPSENLINSTDEEIEGMERIIETLLFLAKPGNSELKKGTINISEELENLVASREEVSLTIPKKSIKLSAHGELFRRVVANLIDNAMKYKSSGKITIELSERGITMTNAVEKDLSLEEISRLTRAFYQGDSSRSGSGYGLGLALVAKIIEIEGWKMDIKTKDKKFIVTISFS